MSQLPTQPFYASPPADESRGRILLFSYHFPPAESAGALRWEKLAGYAAARGWSLDVLTRDPAELGQRNESRLAQLPPGVRLFAVPDHTLWIRRIEDCVWKALRRLVRHAPDASGVGHSGNGPGGPGATPNAPSSFARDELRFDPFSARSWYRGYTGWAEYQAQRSWARRGLALLNRLPEKPAYRLAVSSGPPHGSHLGAILAGRSAGIPYVIDLRDPWSLSERWIEPFGSWITLRVARRYESAAVRGAALVVMNTEPARRAMQAEYPEHAERIVVAMNGFDEDDPIPRTERGDCFLLRYAGTVYLDRSPRMLFAAVARLIREFDLKPGALAVGFMGHIEPDREAVLGAARAEQIEPFVEIFPPGGRREAAEFLAQAHVLINLPQDSHQAIPSKIFEYLRYEAWLLALAERESASEVVLRGSGADVVDPKDVDGIAAALRQRFLQHRRGEIPRALAPNTDLSRATQAKRLFDAVDAVLSR
jgi:glycosyltransferase involved in cell wall biosynthesis